MREVAHTLTLYVFAQREAHETLEKRSATKKHGGDNTSHANFIAVLWLHGDLMRIWTKSPHERHVSRRENHALALRTSGGCWHNTMGV